MSHIPEIWEMYTISSAQHLTSYTLFCHLYREIVAIGTDEAALSLSPISGYLSFLEGERTATVDLSTQDDLLPEPSGLFSLQLTASDGGSHIQQSGSTALITGKSSVHTLLKTLLCVLDAMHMKE